jgi:hypothetical protein
MNTYLEDLIRDAQQRQAGRAVPPERILAKLPIGAKRRERTRRRGALVVAAACAVGLAVGAVPIAIRLGTGSVAPVAGAARWSGTVPDFAHLGSPLEVWPAAVHQIPDVLPNGLQYTVTAVLSSGRYLVKANAAYPMIFDSSTGTARAVSDPVVSARDGGELADVFAAGDQVLWGVQQQGQPYHLWAAPSDGGSAPRLVVRWPLKGEAYPIGVQDGVTYWRAYGHGTVDGIYRLPLETGVPALVPGTEGYHDFGAFPWVRSVPYGRAGSTGGLRNMVSGEHRTWTGAANAFVLDCNPVVCVGQGLGGQSVVQRPDGSGFQSLPYKQQTLPYETPAREGRFGIGFFTDLAAKTWIWDRATGAAATVPRLRLTARVRTPVTVVQWDEPGGGRYVLDLAAIR